MPHARVEFVIAANANAFFVDSLDAPAFRDNMRGEKKQALVETL